MANQNMTEIGIWAWYFEAVELWDANCRQRYGQGTYTWTDGGSYSGGWVEDKREGKGTMKYPDGFVYEGEWKADRVCCSSKILCFNAPIASWPWHLSEPKWYSQIRRSMGIRYQTRSGNVH